MLPDASSMALDRLPGVDASGYAGLQDDVDWHWQQLLAGAEVVDPARNRRGACGAGSNQWADSGDCRDAAERAGQCQSGRPGPDEAKSQRPAHTYHPAGISCARNRQQGSGVEAISAAIFRKDGSVSAKLRQVPIPKTEIVKLTIALSSQLKTDLEEAPSDNIVPEKRSPRASRLGT
jgi:hypothetical protein